MNGDKHDGDRAQEQQVAGGGPPSRDPAHWPSPTDKTGGKRCRKTAGERQEKPGQRVEADRRAADAEPRAEEDHPLGAVDSKHARRRHERAAEETRHKGEHPDQRRVGTGDESDKRTQRPKAERGDEQRADHRTAEAGSNPMARRIPCSRLNGLGGEPGTKTSTGTIEEIPALVT